jgi:hypothetical protein
MNASLTVCTALRTLEMLILKSVESNLFDNAHFIFIRNNPTEVVGVREGVLLIFTKANEQMSSNSSRRRTVRFLQSLSLIWPKSILFRWFIHKFRPLVKPIVVVTTTGQFVAILGPCIARNNDASILNHLLKCNINDIKGLVKDNDIFVVDRGFRDSLTLLEDLGIKAAMPSFMKSL